MAHAKYAPSSLSRLLACPGSLKLLEDVPPEQRETTSGAAREGTELHALLEHGIVYGRDDIDWEGRTPEQKAAVLSIFDYLEPYLIEPFTVFSEVKVHMSNEIYGTADVVSISDEELHVFDAKFGRIPVDVESNPQLLAYLSGARAMFAALNHRMFIHVMQPRTNNFSSYEVTQDELATFKNACGIMVFESKQENPPRRPGTKQCRWCKAVGICPENLDRVHTQAKEVLSAYVDAKDPVTISEILSMKSDLLGAFQTLEDHVFSTITQGNTVPGFKIVSGKSSRAWQEDVTAESLIRNYPKLRYADLIETRLASPHKVEKLLGGEKIDRDLILETIGSFALAPESSKKRAIEFTSAPKTFERFID